MDKGVPFSSTVGLDTATAAWVTESASSRQLGEGGGHCSLG